MAEAFEDRFYALVAEIDGKTREHIEHYRSKGDAAFLCADLSEYTELEDFEDDLAMLMQEFGVSTPDAGTVFRQSGWFVDGYWSLRDITVGELKRTIAAGAWPDGAWSYHKNTWLDRVRTVFVFPMVLIAMVVVLPISLVFSGGTWMCNRVFRKPA